MTAPGQQQWELRGENWDSHFSAGQFTNCVFIGCESACDFFLRQRSLKSFVFYFHFLLTENKVDKTNGSDTLKYIPYRFHAVVKNLKKEMHLFCQSHLNHDRLSKYTSNKF